MERSDIKSCMASVKSYIQRGGAFIPQQLAVYYIFNILTNKKLTIYTAFTYYANIL